MSGTSFHFGAVLSRGWGPGLTSRPTSVLPVGIAGIAEAFRCLQGFTEGFLGYVLKELVSGAPGARDEGDSWSDS
jgi:hypothetical protein